MAKTVWIDCKRCGVPYTHNPRSIKICPTCLVNAIYQHAGEVRDKRGNFKVKKTLEIARETNKIISRFIKNLEAMQ